MFTQDFRKCAEQDNPTTDPQETNKHEEEKMRLCLVLSHTETKANKYTNTFKDGRRPSSSSSSLWFYSPEGTASLADRLISLTHDTQLQQTKRERDDLLRYNHQDFISFSHEFYSFYTLESVRVSLHFILDFSVICSSSGQTSTPVILFYLSCWFDRWRYLISHDDAVILVIWTALCQKRFRFSFNQQLRSVFYKVM